MIEVEEEENFIDCELCGLRFTAVKTYKQHILGKKHKKKEKQPSQKVKAESMSSNDETLADEISEEITCPECDKKLPSKTHYLQHISSEPHRKELRQQQLIRKIDQSIPEAKNDIHGQVENTEDSLLPEPFATCKLCNIPFSGPEAYQQHMISKKHKRQLRNKKALEILKNSGKLDDDSTGDVENSPQDQDDGGQELFCKDCDKAFSGPIPYTQHLNNQSHAKRLKLKAMMKELEALQKGSGGVNLPTSSDDEEDETNFICETCDITLCGQQQIISHIKSKKHLRNVQFQKVKAQLKEERRKKQNQTNGSATNEVDGKTTTSEDDEFEILEDYPIKK